MGESDAVGSSHGGTEFSDDFGETGWRSEVLVDGFLDVDVDVDADFDGVCFGGPG